MYKKKEFHFKFNLPARFKSHARTSIGRQMRSDITYPLLRYYIHGLRPHNDMLHILSPSYTSNPIPHIYSNSININFIFQIYEF